MDSTVLTQVSDNGDAAITVVSEGITYGWKYDAERDVWTTLDGHGTMASRWLGEMVDKAKDYAEYVAKGSPPARKRATHNTKVRRRQRA